ncbi:MAG: DUF445 domain-containing protein, partial [Spirochaetota bacterium]|nr:DUF445 domain-containing protein [Spirochaetota bacterium]
VVGSNMDSMEEKKLGELISQDQAENLSGNILPNLVISLSEKGITENWVGSLMDKMKSSTRKLGEIIPEELVALLSQWVEGELPELLERLEQAVFDSELDKKLHIQFRKVILDYLESLNRVQKFIVNVWGVEERVDDDLPVVIQEAIRQVFKNLSEEESRKQLMEAMNQSLVKLMGRELGELFERVEESGYDDLKNNALDKVREYLTDENIREKVSGGVMSLYDSYKDKKVGELIAINGPSASSAGDYIADFIVNSLRDKKKQDKLFEMVEEKMDKWVETHHIGRLREVLNLEPGDMDRVSRFLSQYLLSLIQKDISYVLEAVNVRQIVTDKINLFPLDKVENIVLSIIEKHLKWINVFGAVIGASIGLMQVIYMILR